MGWPVATSNLSRGVSKLAGRSLSKKGTMDNSLAGRVSSINFLPTSGGNVEEKRKANATSSTVDWAVGTEKVLPRSACTASPIILGNGFVNLASARIAPFHGTLTLNIAGK